jgi:hypothetical protein
MDDDARAKGGYYSMSDSDRNNFDAKRSAFNKARSGLGNMSDRKRSPSPGGQRGPMGMSYNQQGNSMGGMSSSQQYQMMQMFNQVKNMGGDKSGSMRDNLQDMMSKMKMQMGGKGGNMDWDDMKSKLASMKGNMGDKNFSSMTKKGNGSAGSSCGL